MNGQGFHDLHHARILVGQVYLRWAMSAWQDCEADVDEDGRMFAVSIPRKDRRWHVSRYHRECY